MSKKIVEMLNKDDVYADVGHLLRLVENIAAQQGGLEVNDRLLVKIE